MSVQGIVLCFLSSFFSFLSRFNASGFVGVSLGRCLGGVRSEEGHSSEDKGRVWGNKLGGLCGRLLGF